MSVIATDIYRLSALIKKYDTENTELCNELVTVNEAAQKTYSLGTVLGQVTATGKWVISVQSAADGSQNPKGIVIGNSFGDCTTFTVPATTDTKVLILARGKVVVARDRVQYDASFNDAAKILAADNSLKAVNIFVETSI